MQTYGFRIQTWGNFKGPKLILKCESKFCFLETSSFDLETSTFDPFCMLISIICHEYNIFPESQTFLYLKFFFFKLACTLSRIKLSREPHNTPRMHSRAIQSKQPVLQFLKSFLNNAHHKNSPFFT